MLLGTLLALIGVALYVKKNAPLRFPSLPCPGERAPADAPFHAQNVGAGINPVLGLHDCTEGCSFGERRARWFVLKYRDTNDALY